MTDARRPNLFVVGAMRAGTTALHRSLAEHPEVFMCPVKEPNYFARDDGPAWMGGIAGGELARYLEGPMPPRHNALVRRWEEYLRLFRDAGDERVVGESSPSYLYSERAPREIARRCPGAGAVAVLRSPIERAVSHHQMEVAVGNTRRSFAEALGRPRPGHPYVDGGLYAARLERYIDALGTDHVHVITYEDHRDRPGEVLDGLAGFLGVAPEGFPAPDVVNPAIEPRAKGLNRLLRRAGTKASLRRWLPRSVLEAGKRVWYRPGDARAVSEDVVAQLAEIFHPDVRRLEELLGRDLDGWVRVET